MKWKPQWSDRPEDLKLLQQNLLAKIENDFGPAGRKAYCWVLKDEQEELLGGVAGYVHWGWVYVAQVWVKDTVRGQGLGSDLLHHLELWAKENSFLGIYIDTFERSVKEWYERKGFHCFGEIPDFPKGHQRFFLSRSLVGEKP